MAQQKKSKSEEYLSEILSQEKVTELRKAIANDVSNDDEKSAIAHFIELFEGGGNVRNLPQFTVTRMSKWVEKEPVRDMAWKNNASAMIATVEAGRQALETLPFLERLSHRVPLNIPAHDLSKKGKALFAICTDRAGLNPERQYNLRLAKLIGKSGAEDLEKALLMAAQEMKGDTSKDGVKKLWKIVSICKKVAPECEALKITEEAIKIAEEGRGNVANNKGWFEASKVAIMAGGEDSVIFLIEEAERRMPSFLNMGKDGERLCDAALKRGSLKILEWLLLKGGECSWDKGLTSGGPLSLLVKRKIEKSERPMLGKIALLLKADALRWLGSNGATEVEAQKGFSKMILKMGASQAALLEALIFDGENSEFKGKNKNRVRL